MVLAMDATALIVLNALCNSPCCSSVAVRDMIPCSAGPAIDPSAVSGVSANAIHPLVTKPSAKKL